MEDLHPCPTPLKKRSPRQAEKNPKFCDIMSLGLRVLRVLGFLKFGGLKVQGSLGLGSWVLRLWASHRFF